MCQEERAAEQFLSRILEDAEIADKKRRASWWEYFFGAGTRWESYSTPGWERPRSWMTTPVPVLMWRGVAGIFTFLRRKIQTKKD